jgi:hypothetical protein
MDLLPPKNEDEQSFEFAPYLVSSNVERLNITRLQSRRFAAKHQTYVFKWQCFEKKRINFPDASSVDQCREANAFYWQFFVPGAEAFLTANLNQSVALVNGSPVKCHSLVFTSKKQDDDVRQQMAEKPFGSEILLTEPPYVNVSIQKSLDGKKPSKRRLKQLDLLRKQSIVSNEIVIPIEPLKHSEISEGDCTTYRFRDPSQQWRPLTQVWLKPPFPFDLAFSMTIHKAQSRTIPKIIIALTQPLSAYNRMKFAAVFVAFSRVTHSANLRILRHKQQDPVLDFDYLTKLLPCKFTCQFYAGYENNVGQWNKARALRAVF